MRTRATTAAIALLALVASAIAAPPALELQDVLDKDTGALVMRRGTFRVPENRATGEGRMIHLPVVVLPATGPNPKPDPIVSLHGGPGQAAAHAWRQYLDWWARTDRDVVLVSQRGTDGDNRLDCPNPGGDANLQGWLDKLFDDEAFLACRDVLMERADLRWYTTPVAMDDLDALREALGYEQVNLVGGSYGTRAALVYMRRHPEHVRTAMLTGIAPIAFTNPLYHAREAQRALDVILDECAADPGCAEAFPNVKDEVGAILARLEAEPATVTVTHPRTGDEQDVVVTRDIFAVGLRLQMYYGSGHIPWIIHRAFEGDYAQLVQAALERNINLRDQLALGMLMCVTCSEDVARIDPATIPELTDGTFLGDSRVREQIAACAHWPKGVVPANYGEPVECDAPVLILSGHVDPVTGPDFGDAAARTLPNALHVVAPGSHGVGGPCIESIIRAFIEAGSTEGLDVSCVEGMRRERFRVE